MCNLNMRIKSVLKSVGLTFDGRLYDIRKVTSKNN